jgi:hypothetical protein
MTANWLIASKTPSTMSKILKPTPMLPVTLRMDPIWRAILRTGPDAIALISRIGPAEIQEKNGQQLMQMMPHPRLH